MTIKELEQRLDQLNQDMARASVNDFDEFRLAHSALQMGLLIEFAKLIDERLGYICRELTFIRGKHG